MMLVGRLLPRLGARKLIFFGIGVSLAGALMLTRVGMDSTAHTMLVPLLLQGFGVKLNDRGIRIARINTGASLE